jgi:diguanylate cyclase (GGDEF)-like protein
MKEEMIKVAVVGGNQEGLETVALLTTDHQTQVMMVAEPNPSALAYHLQDFGFAFADHHRFTVTQDLQALTTFPELHLIVDASGDPKVHRDLQQLSIPHAVIFNGQCARFLWELRLIQGSDSERKAFVLERIKTAFDSIDLSRDWTELCELLIQVGLIAAAADGAWLYLSEVKQSHLILYPYRAIGSFEESARPPWAADLDVILANLARHSGEVCRIGPDATEPMAKAVLEELSAGDLLVLPIKSEGDLLGVLELKRAKDKPPFQESDVTFLIQLASLAERYFKKMITLKDLQESSLREALQKELQEILSKDLPNKEKLSQGLRQITELLKVPWWNLYVRNPATTDLVLQASNTVGPELIGVMKVKAGQGLAGEAVQTGRVLYFKETVENGLDPAKRVSQVKGRRGAIFLPLVSGTGTVGLLELEWKDNELIQGATLKLLKEAAGLLANSIMGDVERHRMSQKVIKLTAVNEEGLELLSTTDRDKVLRLVVSGAATILDAEAVILRLWDSSAQRYRVASTYGLHQDEIDRALIDLDAHLAQPLRSIGTILAHEDLTALGLNLPANFPYKSVLSAAFSWEEETAARMTASQKGPASGLAGQPLGILSAYNKLQYQSLACTAFDLDDQEILTKYLHYMAKAIMNAQEHQARESLVTIDALTGLRNERYLDLRLPEEIQRAERYHRSLSLLIMEVAHYKELTQTLSNSSRKEILRKIAGVVRETFRNVDILVRLKESRFAVLMPDTGEKVVEAIVRLAKNIGGIKIKHRTSGQTTALQLQVGFSTFPQDAKTREELVEKAARLSPVG